MIRTLKLYVKNPHAEMYADMRRLFQEECQAALEWLEAHYPWIDYKDAYAPYSQRGALYRYLRDEHDSRLPAKVSSVVGNLAHSRWQDFLKARKAGENKGKPLFINKAMPIYFSNQDWRFIQQGDLWYLKTSLLGQRSTPDSWVQVYVSDYHASLLAQATKMGEGKLWQGPRGKWYFLATLELPDSEPIAGPEIWAGVDINLKDFSIAVSVPSKKKTLLLRDGSIEVRRRYEDRRRATIGRSNRRAYGKRGGHGKHKKLEPLTKARGKDSRWMDTLIHQLSRKVVDWLVEQGVTHVGIEDLSNIREDTKLETRGKRSKKRNREVGRWPFFNWRTKLTYKAEAEGMTVAVRKPRYTSQRCSACGYIDRKNRNGTTFQCRNCGYQQNADLNAANNLANPNIENLIERELEARE